MRVWLDPIRLAAREVTASDVLTAIRASNFLSAPGKTENEFVAYAIQTATTLQTPESFGELPVRATGDEIVRLRDVATTAYGAENDDVRVSFNGQEGVFLGVFSSPGANALDTSAAVVSDLPQIQSELPPGMELELVYDATRKHLRIDRRSVQDDRRGGGHRRARHPHLPRLVPLRAGADLHHPAVADRRLLHPLHDGLLHQPPDAARHGALHRPRRR